MLIHLLLMIKRVIIIHCRCLMIFWTTRKVYAMRVANSAGYYPHHGAFVSKTIITSSSRITTRLLLKTNKYTSRQYRHHHTNLQPATRRVQRNFVVASAVDDNNSFLSSHEESPHTIHYAMRSTTTADTCTTITIQDAIHQAQSYSPIRYNSAGAGGTTETTHPLTSKGEDVLLLFTHDPSSPYCQQVGKDYPVSYPLSYYCPKQLLSLGAVWYLPCGCDTTSYNTASIKPVRLNRSDYGKLLQEGDCLRIHYNPRRFLTVHDYDFAAAVTDTTHKHNIRSSTGVILHEDFEIGFTVINKPPNVPGTFKRIHHTHANICYGYSSICCPLSWLTLLRLPLLLFVF